VFPNASFYCGEYTITAHGTDFWGNLGHSAPVTFSVAGACTPDPGDGDGDPGDGDGGGDGDGDAGDGDGETDDGPVETDGGDMGETGDDPSQEGTVDEAGCECSVDARGASGLPSTLALVALAGLGLIRRRDE
jgi:MYXO-CTERM domain-containing protein